MGERYLLIIVLYSLICNGEFFISSSPVYHSSSPPLICLLFFVFFFFIVSVFVVVDRSEGAVPCSFTVQLQSRQMGERIVEREWYGERAYR